MLSAHARRGAGSDAIQACSQSSEQPRKEAVLRTAQRGEPAGLRLQGSRPEVKAFGRMGPTVPRLHYVQDIVGSQTLEHSRQASRLHGACANSSSAKEADKRRRKARQQRACRCFTGASNLCGVYPKVQRLKPKRFETALRQFTSRSQVTAVNREKRQDTPKNKAAGSDRTR